MDEETDTMVTVDVGGDEVGNVATLEVRLTNQCFCVLR